METKKKKSLLKILMVGDAEIGKSSILSKYWKDKFNDKYKATIGADFYNKDIVINKNYYFADLEYCRTREISKSWSWVLLIIYNN